MEWWSLFFNIRKLIFAFIAVTSLLWAIAVSVYISREWHHFMIFQRILVLAVIGINGLSTLLLYLMIVVVFRVWLDLARMLFLLLIHAGAAVMLTLFGHNFSCDIFDGNDSTKICKDVDLAFIIGSWAMTGLILGYMMYLLLMIRVPRPLPKITPNLLLDTTLSSRRSSLASVNSATGLLRHDSARRGTASADINRTQSAPKRLFVVNDAATSPSTPRSASHLKGSKYGAMGSPPRGPPLSARAAPRTPAVTSAASVPPSLQTSYMQGVQPRRQDSQPSPRPLPVPFTNPFLDTLPRNGTPETMVSTTAYQFSRPASQISWSSHMEQYRPLVPLPGAPYAGMNLVNSYPYMVPPITRSYSPDSMYSDKAGYPHYGHYALSPESPYAHPEIKTTGAKLRTHTATPHSIHSVAPSMDLTDGSIPRTLPQAAHIRGDSDPVYRSYSASPRLYPTEQSYPNPFPLVSQAEVRRFGSVPNAHYHPGHDHTRSDEIRNAAHLAGALGRTPPRSETAVTNSGQWKQLVLSAATGRSI